MLGASRIVQLVCRLASVLALVVHVERMVVMMVVVVVVVVVLQRERGSRRLRG